jgi:hypothetical protein
MWQFLEAALSAIPAAATNAYAFGAYALVVLAYVVVAWRVARNKNLLANIEKLPPNDRLSALEVETGGVRLASGISPEQWVRSRIHKYYLFGFLATCAVVVAIAALAMLKGVQSAQALTVIKNEYRLSMNNQPLSGPDLQHVEELVKALVADDRKKAHDAYQQLSPPARNAYQSAYQRDDSSAKTILVPPTQLAEEPAPKLSEARAQPVPAPAPARRTVTSQEAEPNDDILKPNEIPLNTTVNAAIENPNDADFYTFTVSGNRRDKIDVRMTNESTTLAPHLTIYHPNKSVLHTGYINTPGADINFEFVPELNNRYYARISAHGGSGRYRLAITTQNAYDTFEPNDNILSASPITIGKRIEANIMDRGDADYYRLETQAAGTLVVFVENASSTLAPNLTVYNPDKSVLHTRYINTRGADISHVFQAQANSRYYVSVGSHDGFGKYSLIVRPQ